MQGYAYISQGSVYFDVEKYAKSFVYGKLSGRNIIEELAKRHVNLTDKVKSIKSMDFALWKKPLRTYNALEISMGEGFRVVHGMFSYGNKIFGRGI